MMTPTISNLPSPNSAGPGADVAGDSGDLLSEEFAAMFASLCSRQVTLPAAKPEAAPDAASQLVTDVTPKVPAPPVVFPESQTQEVATEVATPSDETDVMVQSQPTFAYDPNAGSTKGEIISKRDPQFAPAPDTEPAPEMVVEPAISTHPVTKHVAEPSTKTPEQLVVNSQTPVKQEPVPPVTDMPQTAPPVEPPSEVKLVEKAIETPNKSLPVPIVKGQPVSSNDPVEGEKKPKTEEVVVETASESVNVKNQTEATRRISNLIATYLIEGARNGTTSTARFGGLEFEFELDPSMRQKRNSSKLDTKSLDVSMRMRPFADLLADTLPAPNDASPVTQVSQKVVELAKSSTREVESLNFKLNPEELGEVDLQLTRHKDGSISAHLTTERETARAVLNRSVEELRQTLEQAGVQVAKLQVSTNAGSMQHSRRQEHDSASRATTNFGNTAPATTNETEASSPSLADNNRLLSLRA